MLAPVLTCWLTSLPHDFYFFWSNMSSQKEDSILPIVTFMVSSSYLGIFLCGAIKCQPVWPSGPQVLPFNLICFLIPNMDPWPHEGDLVMVRCCLYLFILSLGLFSLPHSTHSPRPHSGLSYRPESWPTLPPQRPCTIPLTVCPIRFDYFVNLVLYWPFAISHKSVDLFPQPVKVPQ